MTERQKTQAILLRCRGHSYRSVGRILGIDHRKILYHIRPDVKKKTCQRTKAYLNANKKVRNASMSRWRSKNKRHMKAYDLIRSYVLSIKKQVSRSTVCGCTTNQLKLWLEMHFQSGMSWSNYGEWHIDHVKPLSSFNLDTEFERANHYTNLQPLWAVDNYKKGSNHGILSIA